MRIDLPLCGFHYCRFQFDGNCTSTGKHEKCEYRYLSEQIERERKTGKWIPVMDNNGQHFVCNHCGEWRCHQGQNFCGECGAKMEDER